MNKKHSTHSLILPGSAYFYRNSDIPAVRYWKCFTPASAPLVINLTPFQGTFQPSFVAQRNGTPHTNHTALADQVLSSQLLLSGAYFWLHLIPTWKIIQNTHTPPPWPVRQWHTPWVFFQHLFFHLHIRFSFGLQVPILGSSFTLIGSPKLVLLSPNILPACTNLSHWVGRNST